MFARANIHYVSSTPSFDLCYVRGSNNECPFILYLYFYDLKIDFMQWSESRGGGMKGTVR
jgi:hypothetical protein